MMINGQAYGPLTPDRALDIIKDLYKQEKELKEGGE
jgi:NADH-quinone oxidoreductase subunit E